jgi:hypothetical protein
MLRLAVLLRRGLGPSPVTRLLLLCAILDAQHELADIDLIARFHGHRCHFAGDGGRHLDCRFVGFQLENGLIFRDGVAGLDEDLQHVARGDALTELGKVEVSHEYLLGKALPRRSRKRTEKHIFFTQKRFRASSVSHRSAVSSVVAL